MPVGTVTALSFEGSLFHAFTNDSVTEVLVTMENYKLSRDAWSVYNEEKPYLLRRDLVIRSTGEPMGQLDFSFLANKVLVGSGITLTIEKLALRNVRKLGGFGLIFMPLLTPHMDTSGESEQPEQAVPSPFALLRDVVLRQASGLTAEDIDRGRGQPLEQLGLALTFGGTTASNTPA